jgi:hypothetical protein
MYGLIATTRQTGWKEMGKTEGFYATEKKTKFHIICLIQAQNHLLHFHYHVNTDIKFGSFSHKQYPVKVELYTNVCAILDYVHIVLLIVTSTKSISSPSLLST